MRWCRIAVAVCVAVVAVTACGSAEQAARDPVELIGLWAVEGAGEDGTLRLNEGGATLFRDCGLIHGQWDANTDGLFVAGVSGWSHACGQHTPTPAWLA